MKIAATALCVIALLSGLRDGPAFALEPNEILIIANSNCAESMDVASYYCQKRRVPKDHILTLPLAWPAADTVGRGEYVKLIAEPIRQKLTTLPFKGTIKCLLTTYGVPIKVAATPAEPNKQQELSQLELLIKERTGRLAGIIAQVKLLGVEAPPAAAPTLNPSAKALLDEVDACSRAAIERIRKNSRQPDVYRQWLGYYGQLYGTPNALKMAIEYQKIAAPPPPQEQARQTELSQAQIFFLNRAGQEQWPLEQRIKKGYYDSLEQVAGIKGTMLNLQMEIDRRSGKETNAAVDSELSMVLFGDYDLYRWQLNELKDRAFWFNTQTIMVSRLDGPSAVIAKGLIDKAMAAEAGGVTGKAYFDLRCSGDNAGLYSPGYYDNSLLEAAEIVRQETTWPVTVEKTSKLFEPGRCPQTAMYCGWYSLQKYIPSFTFVTGAVGYHIASWEAIHLRDAASPEWCPSLLKDGITATLGAVAEPYLRAFPEPKQFFEELLTGRCLVEVYYKTLPYNSWQIILIGDPLYQFKIKK